MKSFTAHSLGDVLRILSDSAMSFGGVKFISGKVESESEDSFKRMLPQIHQKLIDRQTIALIIGIRDEITYNYLYIGEDLLPVQERHQAAAKLVETFNGTIIGAHPSVVFAERVDKAIDETISACRRILFGNDYPIQ